MNAAAGHRHQELAGEQLQLLMQQLQVHAGIRIESPQVVIEHNVRQRMNALGMNTPGEYFALLEEGFNARAEWLALVDLLTVKETRFFRQPEALEATAHYVTELMDTEPAPRELSFWSAGCSTGQELYSIAMVIEHIMQQREPWFEWHGIGTDVSFMAINQAQTARYRESAIHALPLQYRHPYINKVDGEEWEVCESIQARTHFFHSNLLHVNSAPFADFNIIFCQNVLIYFEHQTQLWIIDQLVERLQPGGLLVLGAGEDARWTNTTMRRVSWPGVCAYKKIGGSADGC